MTRVPEQVVRDGDLGAGSGLDGQVMQVDVMVDQDGVDCSRCCKTEHMPTLKPGDKVLASSATTGNMPPASRTSVEGAKVGGGDPPGGNLPELDRSYLKRGTFQSARRQYVGLHQYRTVRSSGHGSVTDS